MLVADEEKEFAVMTSVSGLPFHDYWLEGEAPEYPLPRVVADIVENDFGGVVSAFAKKYSVQAPSTNQWCRGKWIIYDGQLYSPQHRHERWVKNQDIHQPVIKLVDLISINYASSDKIFSKEIGCPLNIVQGWIRKGWIIFDGVIYSPLRRIT